MAETIKVHPGTISILCCSIGAPYHDNQGDVEKAVVRLLCALHNFIDPVIGLLATQNARSNWPEQLALLLAFSMCIEFPKFGISLVRRHIVAIPSSWSLGFRVSTAMAMTTV